MCLTIHSQLAGAEKKLSWVGVVGLAENKANSAPIELELELSLTIMMFIEATNVVASRPPERCPTGTPHARANTLMEDFKYFNTSILQAQGYQFSGKKIVLKLDHQFKIFNAKTKSIFWDTLYIFLLSIALGSSQIRHG